MSQEVFEHARRAYDAATTSWRRQRAAGGIVEETDDRERIAGVRWRSTTPEARASMGWWQKAKAELDAAHEAVIRAAGDDTCPTCPPPERGKTIRMIDLKSIPPDPRLPPEKDDDERVPF